MGRVEGEMVRCALFRGFGGVMWRGVSRGTCTRTSTRTGIVPVRSGDSCDKVDEWINGDDCG